MGKLIVRTWASDPERPPSGQYSDADMVTMLEVRARAVLDAERELREATRKWEHTLATARRAGQHAQADAALRGLFDRRPS